MANFEEMLGLFKDASGRYDLVSTGESGDNEDNGAGKFINAGISFIENRLFPSTSTVFEGPLDHTTGVIELDDYTSVKDVYYIDDDDNYALLVKINLNDWLGMDIEAREDIEEPAFWVNLGNSSDKSTVIQIYPEPLAETEFYVRGYKKTSVLSTGSDTNFWTVKYPMLVVHAALYQLEIYYRNFEGAKTWMAALDEELRGIDYNKVEDTLYDKMEMRG